MIINKIQSSTNTQPYKNQQNNNRINKTANISMTGGVIPPPVFIGVVAILGTFGSILASNAIRSLERHTAKIHISKMEPKMLALFEELKDLEGKDFVKKAYELTTNHFGYEGAAPELVFEPLNNKPVGQFFEDSGKMTINEDGLENAKKSIVLGYIWYEFERFMQCSDVYRTEGVTRQSFVAATVNRLTNRVKTDEKACQQVFKKLYQKLKPEEIEKVRGQWSDSLSKDTNFDLYDRVAALKGTIKNGSEGSSIKAYEQDSPNETALKHGISMIEDYQIFENSLAPSQKNNLPPIKL